MKDKLTPKESQRLIELGVDPSKASEVQHFDDAVSQWTNRGYAIFTLSDLLELLPKEIKIEIPSEKSNAMLPLRMNWNRNIKQWRCYYAAIFSAPELIDALFALLCWVVENDYYQPTLSSIKK